MSKSVLSRKLRAWCSERNGATAIEFGILGPVFLSMLCGIMFLGVFLFNCNRVDAATFDAARQAMLVSEPTIQNVKAKVDQAFIDLGLEGASATVTIGQRDDGGDEAVISAIYTMLDPTAFLNSEGFTHTVEYRVPLWAN